jgi:3-methylcrotonyl-CoA carboxylase alpha subunit
MEMNTRLQVEHPVTEEISGVDLVEWQLRVASGEPLPKRQDELSINGWAMEARLYAEDPATGFLPSTGRLDNFHLDDQVARIETGVESGDAVSPFYDPMIAKLIATGKDRMDTMERLAFTCDSVLTWPVKNNAGFLSALLRHDGVRSAGMDTGFIAEHLDALVAGAELTGPLLETGAINIFKQAGGTDAAIAPQRYGDALSHVWTDLLGFRANAPSNTKIWMLADGELRSADIGSTGHGAGPLLRPHADQILVVEKGWPHRFEQARTSDAGTGGAATGAILSPMPGRIIAVAVAAGDGVTKGQKLVTLEAMKMEHSLTAPFDGIVAELNAVDGGQVSEGTLLVRIDKTTE